jgi:hypothetical protein
MRISRFKLLSMAAYAYIEHTFNSAAGPVVFLLFRSAFLGIPMSEQTTGILALTLNSGAYRRRSSARDSIRILRPGGGGGFVGLNSSSACATSFCLRPSA